MTESACAPCNYSWGIRLRSLFVQALAVLSAVASRSTVLVVLFVAARRLTPEQFSALALTLSIAGLVIAVVSGGGDLWLNRFAAMLRRSPVRAAELRGAYIMLSLALAAGVAVLIAAATLSGVIPGYLATALAIGLFGAVLAGLSETLLAVLRAEGRLVPFYLLRDVATSAAFLALVLALDVETAAGFLWLYFAVWAVALASAWTLVRRSRITRFSSASAFRWPYVKLGRHTAILLYGNISSRVAMTVDVVLLSVLLDFARVGDYRLAAQIAIGFMVIQHFAFLTLPWQLRLSPRHPVDSDSRDIIRDVHLRLIGASAVALAALLYLAPDVLGLFNERFVQMTPVLSVLLCLRFTNLLWGPQHETMVSKGLATSDGHGNVVNLVVYLTSFLLLLTVTPVLFAAVAAHIAADMAGHLFRYRVLTQYGVAPAIGGSAAPALPMIGYALVAIYAIIEFNRLV
jgi:O-antigen/teichoic acid export membrane protein